MTTLSACWLTTCRFITNTKVKLVLVVDNGSTSKDEELLRQVCCLFAIPMPVGTHWDVLLIKFGKILVSVNFYIDCRYCVLLFDARTQRCAYACRYSGGSTQRM